MKIGKRPTADVRCGTDVHILMLERFFFVHDTILNNYFNTTHFVYTDFNLLFKRPHNSTNYTTDEVYKKLDTIALHPKDKMSVNILNYWHPSWYNDLRSLYSSYKYICAGLFYTTDLRSGLKIVPKLIKYAEYVTEQGYGHADEQIFGHVIDENLEDFNFSIGDYQDTIENYYKINTNHHYCNWVIEKYRNNYHDRYLHLLPYINNKFAYKPNIYDIPIVCINLDKRTDRWDRMKGRMEKYGLVKNFVRKSACTPDKLYLPFCNKLSPAQKSLAQSHYEVWSDFIKSKEEYILILEDNVQFRKDWIEVVNKKLNTINDEDPEWHALFLNVTEELKEHNEWKLARDQYMTGAILYSRNGVSKLLSMYGSSSNTIVYSSDWMTHNLQYHSHSYTYFPWLAVQDGSVSDLQCNIVENLDYKKMRRLLAEAKYNYETNYDK